MIFACNVYHHLEDGATILLSSKNIFIRGGRIAIIDFKEGAFHHFTRIDIIRNDMEAAGYRFMKGYKFLPKQNFLIYSIP